MSHTRICNWNVVVSVHLLLENLLFPACTLISPRIFLNINSTVWPHWKMHFSCFCLCFIRSFWKYFLWEFESEWYEDELKNSGDVWALMMNFFPFSTGRSQLSIFFTKTCIWPGSPTSTLRLQEWGQTNLLNWDSSFPYSPRRAIITRKLCDSHHCLSWKS